MFYVYDGSFEGFLSAVTEVMRIHAGVSDDAYRFYGIMREEEDYPILEFRTVENIPGIIRDFGDYILRNFGEAMTKTIYHAYLSETEGIENAITEYIFLARKLHRDPIDQLYMDCVAKVADAAKAVSREANRYLGLLRFRKKQVTGSGSGLSVIDNAAVVPEVFIGGCEPVHNCLPLIAGHFVERFPSQFFLILDKGRNICVIHSNGGQWTIRPYDKLLEEDAQFETQFEKLWQKYYKILAIPQRENPKLQQNIMPKRYWKYLVEKPGRKSI